MEALEVTSWGWEDKPVYDRAGNIRYYQKTRVPREYKHLEYEQSTDKVMDWNDTVPFGVDVKKELEEIRRMKDE